MNKENFHVSNNNDLNEKYYDKNKNIAFIQKLVFLHPFYLDVTLDLCCLYYPRKLATLRRSVL